MTQVMKFDDAKDGRIEQKTAQTENEVGPEAVEKLRYRLLNNEYCDSHEVRLAILGELVYQCYKQLQKRKYL